MNLIFDIGNVICEWNPEALLKGIFDTPEQQQMALNSIIQHPDWIMLDKGLIDIEQAIENAASRSTLDKNAIRRVYLETPASLTPHEPVVTAIHDLKSHGYRLYVLSNMQRHSWSWLSRRYDFWSLFDGIVVSFEIHMVKPELEIYQHITCRFGLDPATTLFLDDMPVNIDAARKFGMQTICVVNIPQVLEDLYRHLGI